jgi:hypothetical protein
MAFAAKQHSELHLRNLRIDTTNVAVQQTASGQVQVPTHHMEHHMLTPEQCASTQKANFQTLID